MVSAIPTILQAAAIPVLSLLFTQAILQLAKKVRRRKITLPPAPLASFDPKELGHEPWKAYQRCAQDIGPVFSLHSQVHLPRFMTLFRFFVPPQAATIVLNSKEAILELFQYRSEAFSDRPHWPMAELLGRTENVGFTYYGPQLRAKRRLLHDELNSTIISKWQFLLIETTKKLVADWKTGDGPRESLRTNVETMIHRLAYGKAPSQEFLDLVKSVNMQTGAALQPGRWAVNFLPFLAHIPPWFPGAGFQRWANDAKNVYMRLVREPFELVKRDIVNLSNFSPEIAKRLTKSTFSSVEAEKNAEHLIMVTAGSIFNAGVDTTVTLVETILTILSFNPHIQERAYEEICAELALPASGEPEYVTSLLTFDDQFVYIDYIIKETLRLRPPVPILTHSPSKEEIYNGWTIPKHSWILANIWSLFRDENTYEQPTKFLPERFLDHEAFDPQTVAFGLGRRICPGMHFSMKFAHLLVARTIVNFQISHKENAPRKFEDVEFSTGLTSQRGPKKLDIILTPRK